MNVALRPDSLNLISLCTGGGGLDLGVELAMPGARSVVCVEREAFACGHLVSAMQQGLMAQAAIWSDVTTFNGRAWRGIVDGVIGGIPCQPHSLAGKRAGSEDERDLWSDARRIIVQSGAWFVLIENVSGMLSAKPGLDPGALRVRRDLQRLGFDVEGGLFTASEVGASHERERVFILAVANCQDRRWDVWSASRERHGPQVAAGGRRGDVVHTEVIGRREGRPESGVRRGRSIERTSIEGPSGEFDGSVGHALRAGPHASPHAGIHCGEEGRRSRHEDPDGSGRPMADSDILELRRESPARQQLQLQRDNALGLFPPGPSDLSSWRHTLERAPELEPAFRRVADGLASRLDTARVDRLRLLGNGVVSLEAAYAVRTLATRLAASGSPGAARLVRMMEISATQSIGTESAA